MLPSLVMKSATSKRHPNQPDTLWNSWEALPSIETVVPNLDDSDDDTDDWESSSSTTGDQNEAAEERLRRQCRRHRGCSLGCAQKSGHSTGRLVVVESDASSDGVDWTIPGDVRHKSRAGNVNQSSCSVGEGFESSSPTAPVEEETSDEQLGDELGCSWDEEETAEGEGAEEESRRWAEWRGSQQQQQQPKQQQQPSQQVTTCEEDVIGQRLAYCLQQLQGAPYQECDDCVTTLSTCTDRDLSSRELLDRLNNLETLLLYLQVTHVRDMSCSRLKQLCQLKKTLACMHGCLLKRQATESQAEIARLHRRLDRTGDFRRHWRRVPPGGEKSRIVAEPRDCTPRVAPEDEWLRGFLPDAEKASLGHILADTDPVVSEGLGQRMAFSKLRGRSTRLHNLCSRDAYEDLLRHFRYIMG